MKGQSQNPLAHDAPSSPVNGEAADLGTAIDGVAGPAQVSSPHSPPVSAGASKRTPRKAEQGRKQRDQGNGTAAVAVGLDRVCALLAEAVIGLMAAPAPGDSRQSTGDEPARSPIHLDDQIVEALRESGTTSPAALRAKLGLQRTPCTKALNRLVARGVLVGEGSTRNRIYRLAQPSQSAAA